MVDHHKIKPYIMSKEEIIENIVQRIKDEYKKHKELDWAKIAAHKIYSTFDIKPKQR